MRAYRYRTSEQMPPENAQRHDLNIILDLYELERIRQALRRELRVHTGQETLAREIGISRGSLRKLLETQSVPTPRVLQRLRDWSADRPEVWTPIDALALALLVRDLPAEERGEARLQLARTLGNLFTQAGRPVPDWLAQEMEP